MSNFLKEYRCEHCNKLFFKGDLTHCTVEIKCKNCKKISVIKGVKCKLFLSLKKGKKETDNDLKVLKNKDIEEITIHCSDCEKNNECGCYEDLKNDCCPICKKKLR